MLVWYEQEGIVCGPVFCDERGNRVRAKQYEVEILTQLEWIQTNLDDLISPNVNVFEPWSRFSSRVKWESSESRGVTDGDRFEQQMEYVRASERQEDEFEYVCALYGSPLVLRQLVQYSAAL